MEWEEQKRKAVICGWALGAIDSGFILTNTQHLGFPFPTLIVSLCALSFYGLGGWFLALILNAVKRQLNWSALYWVGVVGVLLLCWRRNLPVENAYLYPMSGILISLGLWRLIRAEHAPRIVSRIFNISCLVPFGLWAMFGLPQVEPVRGAPPSTTAPSGAPNVVLVSWDTVRADSLPLWGGGGLETPALDWLAADGIVFDDFQAVASITAPAHTSMLTGLYPPTHGLRSNGNRAPDIEEVRLPELLRSKGWHTGAFVSALPVAPKFGFDVGFEIYDYRSDSSAISKYLQLLRFSSSAARLVLPNFLRGTFSVSGETVVARASSWLEDQKGPVFMWVHLFDAHGPYLPADKWRERVLLRAEEGPHAIDPVDEEALVLQRGEIEQVDQQLADLLISLDRNDPGLENTMVIVLADHGECFGEGGIHVEHEGSLFAATQHIPAVIRLPGGSGGGVRCSDGPFSQIDLAPTICKVAGIEPSPDWQGLDLLTALESGLNRKGVYMEAFMDRLGQKRLQGWIEGDWKYVRSLSGEERLWLRGQETRDLAAQEPERLDYMSAALDEFLSTIIVRKGTVVPLTEEERTTMEALGYLDAEE